MAKKYPDDPEAQTLYAEALMDLTPWNYWDGRGTKPRAGTLEVVATLERTIKRCPTTPAPATSTSISWRPRPRPPAPSPAPTGWPS